MRYAALTFLSWYDRNIMLGERDPGHGWMAVAEMLWFFVVIMGTFPIFMLPLMCAGMIEAMTD